MLISSESIEGDDDKDGQLEPLFSPSAWDGIVANSGTV